jgi:hypothetical protein
MGNEGKRHGADKRHAVRAAVAAAMLLATACTGTGTGTAAPPGMTYASIEHLPDFSGWWYLDLDRNAGFGAATNALLGSLQPVLKPQLQEQYERLVAFFAAMEKNAGALPDPVDLGIKPDYCAPPVFAGFNGGFEDNVEFLFTPGRVTITSELGMLRRVYLGRDLPADVDETKMGTSVGHWEGKTLVVETAGLDHTGELVPGIKLGKGARVVERISLKEAGTMEIARRIVAPEILTVPYETTLVYRRSADHVFHESSNCQADDRSINHETERQQLDLTPPADLPPPPQ